LADYKIPGILDLPEMMSNVVIDANQNNGPFGAKGVGESGTFGVSPAIANAIEDAIGVRIMSLPITPEKVYRAICAARNEPLED
jgi:CO/xanthine dehydrogenase Mo-binding subunit